MEWKEISPDIQVSGYNNQINADNMPIGINAQYSSIAIYKNTPYVACCDNGRLIIRKGHKGPQYVWGRDTLGPTIKNTSVDTSAYCSYSCLVANNSFLFLAFICRQKVHVFRYDGKIWQDMHFSTTPIIDVLSISLDNDGTTDKLYMGYIQIIGGVPPVIGAAICSKINASLPSWNPAASLPNLHANNISISGFAGTAYLVFSNFVLPPFLLNTDDSRARTLYLDSSMSSWSNYGYYENPSSSLGFVSALNADGYSTSATFNTIEAVKKISNNSSHNFLYVGWCGGLTENGSGQMNLVYSNFTNTAIPSHPIWHDSEIKFQITPDVQVVISSITSAIDRKGYVYYACCTDNGANSSIKIHQFIGGKLMDTSLNFPSNMMIAEMSYISLAFDNANTPFITFINRFGLMKVYAFLA